MPAELTYPGVYIEEIPSGVRTIIGVSTSIAAFVGRTPRGPTDRPVLITSFADYERIFGGTASNVLGGLDNAYPIGFSVRDFYLNGGSLAIICRADKGGAFAEFDAFGLKLIASSPGAWANQIRVRVVKADTNLQETKDTAAALNVLPGDLFHLTVRDGRIGGDTETFPYLTAVPSARDAVGVLANQSNLVRVKDPTATYPSNEHDRAAKPEDWWKDPNSAAVKTNGAISGALNDAAAFGSDGATPTGLFLLRKADLFNLLVIPPDKLGDDVPKEIHPIAAKFCKDMRAFYIVDPSKDWNEAAKPLDPDATKGVGKFGITGDIAKYAALYFPRVLAPNPLQGDQPGVFTASGAIAGVMARTDVARGVWKAPAGVDATLTGVTGLTVLLNDLENGQLNKKGINCLRTFAVYGNIVWGARTMRGGDDTAETDYKYVPVRRVANFIEESLFRGLKWVVFEPNDEPLWAQIRLNVGAFMHDLFRQGAFQGTSPRDAYFVRCDKTTTTQNDINKGVVNIVVGFAPLKPAEFVVLKLTQIAGQIQT